MRIAIVAGILLSLVGCNGLPPEPVTGDDQSLQANAGHGGVDAPGRAEADSGVNASGPANAHAAAEPVKGDVATTSGCGRDCDAEARGCFAKGGDAKSCDALYHQCLAFDPGKPDPDAPPKPGVPPDVQAECHLKYKGCLEANVDVESCDALLKQCSQF